MKIEKYKLEEHNYSLQKEHKRKFDFIASEVRGIDALLQKLIDFQVAIPSWALGTGGTRFGRFGGGGEPRRIEADAHHHFARLLHVALGWRADDFDEQRRRGVDIVGANVFERQRRNHEFLDLVFECVNGCLHGVSPWKNSRSGVR